MVGLFEQRQNKNKINPEKRMTNIHIYNTKLYFIVK